MDEQRFVVKNLLRHFPPLPKVPAPVAQILREADQCLALGQPELAMESLALVLNQLCQPPTALGQVPPFDIGYAIYFSDCLTCAVARASAPVRPSLDESADPRGPIGVVVPSLDSPEHAAVLRRLIEAAAARDRRVVVCVTDEDQPRDPPLRIWKTGASAQRERVPLEGWLKSTSASCWHVPRQGDLLAGAGAAVSRLREACLSAVVFVGGLRSPMAAAIASFRAGPRQVSLATHEPCVVRHIHVVATLGEESPKAWAAPLARRGIELYSWPRFVDEVLRRFEDASATAAVG